MGELNVKNRTIFCKDNLDVLVGINSKSIDLIYLDPPFNKKKLFTAPIGTSAEGASFSDIFKEEDVKDGWLNTIKEDHYNIHHLLESVKVIEGKGSYNFCYLAYMAIRLVECHRVLADTGSIYLHCDQTMSHYLKLLMDCIFDEKQFKDEIAWKRATSTQKGSQHKSKSYGKNYDVILFYCKDSKQSFFEQQTRHLTDDEINKKFKNIDSDGKRWFNDSAHIWRTPNMGARPNLCYEWRGFKNKHPSGWRLSKTRMEEEYKKGNFEIVTKHDNTKTLIRKKYLHDYRGGGIGNLWNDIKPPAGKERTGYPTQKPVELLERIIKASSNKGDVVLDPFCGCATTCVAAEKLDRRWVGIDVSVKAYELVTTRIKKSMDDDQEILFKGYHDPVCLTDAPTRTDLGKGQSKSLDQKYVYIISNPAYPDAYKVGIAKDVGQRLKSYQTSDPERSYKVEYQKAFDDVERAREVEKKTHQKFKALGEWCVVGEGNWGEIRETIEEYNK